MPKYKLKIMVNISDPSITKFQELTSSMLEYTGKSQLDKYPYIDPDVEFVPELRDKIQNMSYNKKLETFFNGRLFDNTIVRFKKEKNEKTNTKEIDQFLSKLPVAIQSKASKYISSSDLKFLNNIIKNKTFEKDAENYTKIKESFLKNLNADEQNTFVSIEKKFIEEKIKEIGFSSFDKNFEFTIQTILCTGFPVANYYQTMEFYDKTISNKKITLKGSKGTWDFILPSKFSRCFSYIKLGNKTYTTTGVIWLNDALNHPVYKKVIKSYKKYKKETENIRDKKSVKDNTKSIDDELNKLYINMYFNKEIWNDEALDRDKKRSFRNDTDRESIIFRDNVQKIIKNDISKSTVLDLSTEDSGGIIKIFDEYKEIKKDFEKDSNKSEAYRIYEVLLNYMDTFFSNKDETLIKKIKLFSENEDIKKSKRSLKELIKSAKPQIIRNLSGQVVKYKNILNSSKLRENLYKDEMYNIIENNEDYRDREKEEVEKIDSLLKSEFPNYSEYSKSMKELETDRKVSNPFWKEEVEKYTGKKNKILKKDKDKNQTKDEESFFDVLMKCEDTNSSCKNNPDALMYLKTGIDELQNSEKETSDKVFEAYVQVNVAEGKITEKNYDKLICPYIDEVLGDYIEKDEDVKGENYILKNSVFVNLKDKIEQLKIEEEKIKSAKELKKNNSVKKFKGGKRKSKTKRNYS